MNRSHPKRVVIVLFMAICYMGTGITASADEDGQQLFRDLQDQQLDQFSLLEAALVVGGWDHESSQAVVGQWSREVDDAFPDESTLHRVQHIMHFMHDSVLTGKYDESASQLTVTVSTGNYNCVSAATLFLGLAEINDLSARGVLLPGHLRCRVWIPEQHRWIDLEPTKRVGFLVPQESPGTGRELDSVQVLAKSYYNRGIELLSERDYWAALRCTTYGAQLDPLHAAARDSVNAVINNWSLSLCERQRFEDAAYLLEQGRRTAPQDQLLAASEVHVYVVWMQHLLRLGDSQAAEARLADVLLRHPNSELLRSLALAIGGV